MESARSAKPRFQAAQRRAGGRSRRRLRARRADGRCSSRQSIPVSLGGREVGQGRRRAARSGRPGRRVKKSAGVGRVAAEAIAAAVRLARGLPDQVPVAFPRRSNSQAVRPRQQATGRRRRGGRPRRGASRSANKGSEQAVRCRPGCGHEAVERAARRKTCRGRCTRGSRSARRPRFPPPPARGGRASPAGWPATPPSAGTAAAATAAPGAAQTPGGVGSGARSRESSEAKSGNRRRGGIGPGVHGVSRMGARTENEAAFPAGKPPHPGAEGETRTPTRFPSLRPERSASTNSTTSALGRARVGRGARRLSRGRNLNF